MNLSLHMLQKSLQAHGLCMDSLCLHVLDKVAVIVLNQEVGGGRGIGWRTGVNPIQGREDQCSLLSTLQGIA